PYLRNVGVLGAKNHAMTPKYAPKFVGLSARRSIFHIVTYSIDLRLSGLSACRISLTCTTLPAYRLPVCRKRYILRHVEGRVSTPPFSLKDGCLRSAR